MVEPARQHFEKREVVLSKAALMEGVYTPMERVFVMKAFLEIAVSCNKVNLNRRVFDTHFILITRLPFNSEHNHSASSVFSPGRISRCDIQGFEKLKIPFLWLIFSIRSLIPCIFLV